MQELNVRSYSEVNEANRNIFDTMKKNIGFVPNIYATLANSDTAPARFLAFDNGPTSLSNRQKEVVKLVVSQVNGCRYCQSAHSVVAKMNGFTGEQILEIRSGEASFDENIDALARLTRQLVTARGNVDDQYIRAFYDAGFTNENLVDVLLTIASITALNYLHNLSQVPVDFPVAPELETA
jgi:uncharacterized peroxidase-related enzyme